MPRIASNNGNKVRTWCFTLNNYTPEELAVIYETVDNSDVFKYAIIGKETGESGTPHLQGYLVYKNPVRFNTVRQAVSMRSHIEPAKGTAVQNVAYCSKEDAFREWGTRPISNKDKGRLEKERYSQAWDHAARGNLEDIDADLRIRHYSTLKRIFDDKMTERQLVDTEEEMLWYWGASGTGKSRKARTDNPDAYLKNCNKWWDGYTDQQVCLLEDFDQKHSVLVHHLKIWADRYPFLGELKGSTRKIRPRRLIVTSNYHPRDIWTDASDLEPILRRFKIVEFKRLGVPCVSDAEDQGPEDPEEDGDLIDLTD